MTGIAALAGALAACSIVLVVLWARTARSPQSDLLEARLAQFTESGRAVQSLAEVEMTLPFFERVLRPTLDRWGRRLTARNSQQRTQALQEKLNLAGRPWGLTVGGFLVLRLIAVILVAFAGLALAALLGMTMPQLLLGPAVGLVVGYLLPDALLSRRIRSRQKEILLALPSALDLLTISVEAGLGFDSALGRVCDKYRNALASEFNQVLNEIRLGRPRPRSPRRHGPAQQGGRAEQLHPGRDPVGAARCRHRQRAAHPVRGDPAPASPARRGGGSEGPTEDALPDGLLHLPHPLRGPARPGRPAGHRRVLELH